MYNKKLIASILTLTLSITPVALSIYIANASTKAQAITTVEKVSPYKITKKQKDILNTYTTVDISNLKKAYASAFSNFFKIEEAELKAAKKHEINNYLIHSYRDASILTDISRSSISINEAYTREEHSVLGHYNINYKDPYANKFKQSMKDMLKITMDLSDSQIKQLENVLPNDLELRFSVSNGTPGQPYHIKSYKFGNKEINLNIDEAVYSGPDVVRYFYSYYKPVNVPHTSFDKTIIPITRTLYNSYIERIEEANEAQANFIKTLPKGFILDKSITKPTEPEAINYIGGSIKELFYKSATKAILDTKTKKTIAKITVAANIIPVRYLGDKEVGSVELGCIRYTIRYTPLKEVKRIKSQELQYITDVALAIEPKLNKNTLKALNYSKNNYAYPEINSAEYKLYSCADKTPFGDSYELTISKSNSIFTNR